MPCRRTRPSPPGGAAPALGPPTGTARPCSQRGRRPRTRTGPERPAALAPAALPGGLRGRGCLWARGEPALPAPGAPRGSLPASPARRSSSGACSARRVGAGPKGAGSGLAPRVRGRRRGRGALVALTCGAPSEQLGGHFFKDQISKQSHLLEPPPGSALMGQHHGEQLTSRPTLEHCPCGVYTFGDRRGMQSRLLSVAGTRQPPEPRYLRRRLGPLLLRASSCTGNHKLPQQPHHLAFPPATHKSLAPADHDVRRTRLSMRPTQSRERISLWQFVEQLDQVLPEAVSTS